MIIFILGVSIGFLIGGLYSSHTIYRKLEHTDVKNYNILKLYEEGKIEL